MQAELIQYALDQLDREHVGQLADVVRERWRRYDDVVEACYQPGDGTFYALLFVPLAHEVFGAPGGGTGSYPPHSGFGVERDGSYALVYYAQPGRGLVVGLDEFVAPDRIESYLGVRTASLVAVAVFLNRVTGQDDEWINNWIEANS